MGKPHVNKVRNSIPLADTIQPVGAPECPWSHPRFLALRDQQKAFLKVYLSDSSRNASNAWRSAGLPGAAANVRASQTLKNSKVAACVAILGPMAERWNLWQIQQAAPGEKVPEPIEPKRLRKKDLVALMSCLARGVDPRWRESDPAMSTEYPIQLRAQDMISAGKLLSELKGWRKQSLTLEGNPKKPLGITTPAMSRADRMARIEELHARRALREARSSVIEMPASALSEALPENAHATQGAQ